MTTTTVYVTIEATNVSNSVKHLDVWQDVNAVDRFKIVLRNTGGVYSNTFTVNQSVGISLNGALLINGMIDTIYPRISDSPDILTQYLEIDGRGTGRELSDLSVNKYYGIDPDTGVIYKADNMIDDMLTDAGATITYTPPGTASSLTFDSRYGYLLDNFRKICENVGYDFYVDTASVLQLFAAGSLSSGIVLDTDSLKNILSLVRDEADGLDLKNYVIVVGDNVKDGWTEFNSVDWSKPTGSILSDDSIAKSGAASIKFVKAAASESYVELDFTGTRYGYNYLDFSALASDNITFGLYFPASSGATAIGVYLTDSTGNQIATFFGTDIVNSMLNNPHWESMSVAVGRSVAINDAIVVVIDNPPFFVNGQWFRVFGTTFDWRVAKFRVVVYHATTFYIDDLTIPNNIRMISISQNGASQSSYGVRQIVIDKMDVASQYELDSFAVRYVTLHKDPMGGLDIVAKGTAGLSGLSNNWEPGYTVTVTCAAESLSAVSYRMVAIHHVFDTDTLVNGYDFTTTVSLSPTAQSLDIRRWENTHRDIAIQRELREQISVLQKKLTGVTDVYPALPQPLDSFSVSSKNQWTYVWEAEEYPVILGSGSTIVSGVDASKGAAVFRGSGSVSGMICYVPTSTPGFNDYIIQWRMKVLDNTISSTIGTVVIYDENAGRTIISKNINPVLFGSSGIYQAVGLRADMQYGKDYTLRVQNFIPGITDLYIDWIGITNTPIAIEDIDASKIADGAITGPKIVDGAVSEASIADNAITENKLSDDAVTNSKLADDSVSVDNLQADSVTADAIAANSIYANSIQANAVTANAIAANSIYANSIQANAVTANAIQANSINANHLTANSVTTTALAANSVTANAISANSVVADKIAANAVTANSIAANAVTAGSISANAVTANSIAVNSVYSDAIQANSIVANKIVANSITADAISANAITTNKIVANSVTSDKIIGQAISIGKLATNIATQSFAPLYTDFNDFIYTTASDSEEVGAVTYTRTEYAEPHMLFKLKEVFFSLKTDSGAKVFCDVYAYSGVSDISGIFDVTHGGSFTITKSGSGSYDWSETDYAGVINGYRNRGTQRYWERGVGGYSTISVMNTLPSSINISNYTHIHVANGSPINSTGWEMRFGTDASNYFYVTFAAGDWTATNTTTSKSLVGMLSVGTPNLANINYITIIPSGGSPTHLYVGSIWFTKCFVGRLETANVSYVDYDSGELDISKTMGEDIYIKYYTGQGKYGGGDITLEYPASKIYNVGYPEAFTA